MSKILCERMKGRQLNTAFGQFNFDQQGIAEVPDEHANKLLALNGYKLVGGKPAEPEKEDTQESVFGAQDAAEGGQMDKTSDEGENDQNDDESDAEQSGEDAGQEDEKQLEQSGDETEEEDAEQGEEPEKSGKPAVTVEYLNGKNVAQLKKIAKDNGIDLTGATKKDEIIPIILGAMNQ